MEIFFKIHSNLSREAPGGREYTQQAFQMIPTLFKPNILDIGCGPGEQTLELARFTEGKITAIDTHQPFLDSLEVQAKTLGFSERITCLNQSMFELNFLNWENSFDIVWAEGSIYIIGLETGLKQWHCLLKPTGYMIISELVWLKNNPPSEIQLFWQSEYPGMQTLDEVLTLIPECGYKLIGNFTLPQQAWWNYYLPVEARINQLCSEYKNDSASMAILESEQREIEMYRKYNEWYSYSFFILEKLG